MAAWLFGGGGDAIQTTSALSGAEQVGAVIGTGLAIGFLTTVWVIGAVIFGIMAIGITGWVLVRFVGPAVLRSSSRSRSKEGAGGAAIGIGIVVNAWFIYTLQIPEW